MNATAFVRCYCCSLEYRSRVYFHSFFMSLVIVLRTRQKDFNPDESARS